MKHETHENDYVLYEICTLLHYQVKVITLSGKNNLSDDQVFALSDKSVSGVFIILFGSCYINIRLLHNQS